MIDLTSDRQAKIKSLAKEYNLDLLLLFGSQVTGQTHKESDYDIGYLSHQKLDLDDQGRLINSLLFLDNIKDERLINLVNIKKADPLLLYAITKQAQLLFEKEPDAFATLSAYAFKQYIETKPLREMAKNRLRQKINL